MTDVVAESAVQAAGNTVEIDGEPTAVYRLYDQDGGLLYVGVSCNPAARLNEHAAKKSWWRLVARKTAVLHGSRGEALAEEDRAIRTESPVHNVAGRPLTREERYALKVAERKLAATGGSAVPPQDASLLIDLGELLSHVEGYAKARSRDINGAVCDLVMEGLLKYYDLPDRAHYEKEARQKSRA